MLSRFLIIVCFLMSIACESDSEPSLEAILKNTENFSEDQQRQTIQESCSNPANSEELITSFNALLTSTSSQNCVELGAALVGAQELDLSGKNIKDLSPLSQLTSLTILNLSSNRIEDISLLANLRNLSSLDLSNNAKADVEPVSNLITLANLNLAQNALSNIEPVSRLLNLLSLNLSYNAIENITPFKNLKKLVTFEFSDNPLGTSLDKSTNNCPYDIDSAEVVRDWCNSRNQVPTFLQYCLNYDNVEPDIQKTLDALKGFKTCEEADVYLSGLSTLDLSLEAPPTPAMALLDPDGYQQALAAWLAEFGPQRLTNVAPLASLNNLSELNLNNHNITNLDPISYLTNLKSLKIQFNGFSDISALSELTGMIVLDITSNQVSDLSAISQMTSLTGLVAYFNTISDLSPMAELTFLSGVGLGFNQIVDLSPIKDLTQLFVMDIRGNQITSLSPLSGYDVLTSLRATDNNIPKAEASCPTQNVHPLLSDFCTTNNAP